MFTANLPMTLSLCLHQAMSSTGPLWPATRGWSGATLPNCNKFFIKNCFLFQISVFSHLAEGQNQKSSAAPRLDNTGDEFWIDTTKCGVPGGLRYSDVVVALLSFVVGPEYVTEFRLTNNTKRHLDEKLLESLALVYYFFGEENH